MQVVKAPSSATQCGHGQEARLEEEAKLNPRFSPVWDAYIPDGRLARRTTLPTLNLLPTVYSGSDSSESAVNAFHKHLYWSRNESFLISVFHCFYIFVSPLTLSYSLTLCPCLSSIPLKSPSLSRVFLKSLKNHMHFLINVLIKTCMPTANYSILLKGICLAHGLF